MATRVVEGKQPYTGGKAIEITDDKVINLRLRDENNLIIYDAGDNEIYVDLQLPDEITPTDAFPVGITTGRVIVDNGWDVQGTIIVAKTTSGDNIKILYADDGKLYMDNGTGSFKQIYFKADVDLIVDSLQAQIDVLSGLGKFLSLWDCATGEPISFPLEIPYEYSTGDWYMINNIDNTTNYRPSGTEYDETASSTVETDGVNIGDVYIYDGTVWLLQKNAGGGGGSVTFAQILGQPADNTNLATALNAKQDLLTAGTNIQISNNVISATGGADIVYATQAEYNALPSSKLTDGKHYVIYKSDSRLPAEYQEVEWIQSDGNQRIDTGFKPNQDTRTVIDYQIFATGIAAIGCYNGSVGYIINANAGTYGLGFQYGSSYVGPYGNYTDRFVCDYNRNEVYANETLLHTFTATQYQVDINARLFGWNNQGTISNNGQLKLWSCKIYDNGTLARDFVPCYRKSDDEIGLYDLVNDIFYINQGSGAFTKGTNV